MPPPVRASRDGTFFGGNDVSCGSPSLFQSEPAEAARFIAEIIEVEVFCVSPSHGAALFIEEITEI